MAWAGSLSVNFFKTLMKQNASLIAVLFNESWFINLLSMSFYFCLDPLNRTNLFYYGLFRPPPVPLSYTFFMPHIFRIWLSFITFCVDDALMLRWCCVDAEALSANQVGRVKTSTLQLTQQQPQQQPQQVFQRRGPQRSRKKAFKPK